MIRFDDYPEFRPNLTPREIIELGSFGGTYWRPICSAITGKCYKDEYKKLPRSYWVGIPLNKMTRPWEDYDKNINKYGVKVGTTLEFWEKKGWITKYDPYGAYQWYCHFYYGRRTPDDKRQINRWIGVKNRFLPRLKKLVSEGKDSPKIRQTLLHWGIDTSNIN
jgi:hypothetical protein